MRLPALRRRNPALPEGFDGVLVLRKGRPYDPAWDLWRPLRRWPGILLSFVVTLGLVGIVSYRLTHHVTAKTPTISVPKHLHLILSGTYFPNVPDTSPALQHFSGTTSKFALPFTMNSDLHTWNFECRCTNNFDVIVRNSKGAIIDIPVNEIGKTRVSAVASYTPGNYTMDVTADGKWTVNFVNEAMLPAAPMPFNYLSSGTSIIGPFSSTNNHLSVGYIATLGQLLYVQVVDSKGTSFGYPIYTLRRTSKQVTLTNIPKKYYLVVSGVGLWLVLLK